MDIGASLSTRISAGITTAVVLMTHLLDKEAGSTLIIYRERRGGRAVVTDVR